MYTNTLHLFPRYLTLTKFEKRSVLVAMGLLELPDLRHTLVDIGTTLLCFSGYNGLPGRTLPINLIVHYSTLKKTMKTVFLRI